MQKRWHIHAPDPETVKNLAQALGCHRAVAAVLVNRGITDPQQARHFLKPALSDLKVPSLLQDMDHAVERVIRAIHNKERICIVGDYDTDGVTATVLLLEFLEETGARVTYHIPHRLAEGYGFQEAHVTDVAVPFGASLVITVDCGISNHEAVEAAVKQGMDVIVTDHHAVGETLPGALAVVCPKRPDCESGLAHLAGVGVVFFLCIALRAALREQGFWTTKPEPNLKRKCDLVALGTIADMVPLVKENRILVRAGLEIMRTRARPGVAALMEKARVDPQTVSAVDLAYKLAPRLNAAGRMDCAETSVELLRATDMAEALRLAGVLEIWNQKRRDMEAGIHDSIRDQLESSPVGIGQASLVLAREGWHQGVLGITAARLSKEVCRPVLLIGLENGVGKGSARGITGVNLFVALTACERYLEAFGGHALAAGITIKEHNIPAFIACFEQAIAVQAADRELGPELWIDSPLALGDIGLALADEIEHLGPFGTDNAEPVFFSERVGVHFFRILQKKHRRMLWVPQDERGIRPIAAIEFGTSPVEDPPPVLSRAAYRVRSNRPGPGREIQLVVEDLQF